MTENKKKTVYAKAIGVFLLSMIAYYSTITYLYLNTSPHWVWGLYLSPIFLVFVFLSCLMFIHIELENKNRSDSEEDFCLTLVILSFMLMWWPIFLLIYLQVYEEILIIFEPVKGELTQFQNITYESENYVILMFNIPEELGYGCLTDHYHASITTTPLPYNFYDIHTNLTNIKLPSWLCGDITKPIPDQLYLSANKINGQRIVVFEYPNYVDSFFKVFIGSIFQCACIFASVLLLSILLILGQENKESSIRKPSRKRRMYAFISSYILYVCVFSTNNLWIVFSSLVIGTIFLILSLQSQIHRHFRYLIKGLVNLGNQNTLMKIIMIFIAFLFTLIYIPFILISSQMVFHFKIYLGRHFVALYQGQPEEPLDQYDYYVNIWTTFSWLWYIILIIELNIFPIGIVSYILTMIMCIIQLLNLIIVFCYRNRSQPFLKQQWKIYYTTYKIIQQSEDEQQEDHKGRQIKDIELQFQ